MFEIGLVAVILWIIIYKNNIFDKKRFFIEAQPAFNAIKEEDHEFLLAAKNGPGVNAEIEFNKNYCI